MNQKQRETANSTGQNLPWYQQFWPWFIIALPAAAVIGSFFTLWLAVSNPDHLVVDKDEYQRLNSGLKAQVDEPEASANTHDETEPRID
jgi:hypothetical protein